MKRIFCALCIFSCFAAATAHAVVLRNAEDAPVTVYFDSMGKQWAVTLQPGERYRDYMPGIGMYLEAGQRARIAEGADDEYMVHNSEFYPERFRRGGNSR